MSDDLKDLKARLRNPIWAFPVESATTVLDSACTKDMREAADEIERLESLVAEAVRVIQHLADQQAMLDDFYKETLSRLEAQTNE